MEIIFNRQVRCLIKGIFRTAVDRDNDGVVVSAFYRRSRIKACLKEAGRCGRVAARGGRPGVDGDQARAPFGGFAGGFGASFRRFGSMPIYWVMGRPGWAP